MVQLSFFSSKAVSSLLQKIDDCRNLEKTCAEGSGAEWFQIAHVPNIRINGKYIKRGEDSEGFHIFYDTEEYDVFDDDSEDD